MEIDSMPQMVSTELNLFWMWNILSQELFYSIVTILSVGIAVLLIYSTPIFCWVI